MGQHVFRAVIWEHAPEEPGSWHFLTLPEAVSDDIALEAGPQAGFGSIKVVATIGSTTWRTSLFPYVDARSMVLPVKKQVRQSEGLHPGTICEITLEVASLR